MQEQDKWAQRYAGTNEDRSRRLTPNLYRYVSHFWSDHVLSDPPLIIYGDVEGETEPIIPDTREQEALNLIAPNIIAESKRAVVDMVKYGSAVLGSDVPFYPRSIDPRLFYTVVKPEVGRYEGAISCLVYQHDPHINIPDRIVITRTYRRDIHGRTNNPQIAFIEHRGTNRRNTNGPRRAPCNHCLKRCATK